MHGAQNSVPVGVLGTGSYVPSHIVSNDEVGAPAGVDHDWIHGKTGIRNRRWAKSDEATSDLAVIAGREALESAGIRATQLSLIVVATSTPDQPQPPTAAVVAAELGADQGTAAFDVNGVCTGFLFALTTAQSMLAAAGGGGYALVIGADVYSRILNPTDRRTTILFGDGAGAAVLGTPAEYEPGSQPGPERGVLANRLASYAADRHLIEVPGGGSRIPTTAETLAEGLQYFTMNGRGVRDFVADNVPPAIRGFLAEHGLTPADLDHFVPHQANGRMLDNLSVDLGVGEGRTWTTYEEYGNTGSASVPITLDRAARSGRLNAGDLVLLAGFGGGMALGLSLIRW
ncbi:3-oxoacyl-ACP synthase III family protein [Streptomyces sp. NPDC002886]|uniref:3-oxoacyl-ACP synthase III family protein n=1 Tax=Streptomyces sp. NPDC002886 TaxID=3364667 RepID=UPI0036B1F215